jgi:hypothetical protein
MLDRAGNKSTIRIEKRTLRFDPEDVFQMRIVRSAVPPPEARVFLWGSDKFRVKMCQVRGKVCIELCQLRSKVRVTAGMDTMPKP